MDTAEFVNDLIEFEVDEIVDEVRDLTKTERTKARLAARHLVDIIDEIQRELGDFD